jgi:hypothetical protein
MFGAAHSYGSLACWAVQVWSSGSVKKAVTPPPSMIKFYVCRPSSTTWDNYETIYGMTIALRVTAARYTTREASTQMRLSQRRKGGAISETVNPYCWSYGNQ